MQKQFQNNTGSLLKLIDAFLNISRGKNKSTPEEIIKQQASKILEIKTAIQSGANVNELAEDKTTVLDAVYTYILTKAVHIYNNSSIQDKKKALNNNPSLQGFTQIAIMLAAKGAKQSNSDLDLYGCGESAHNYLKERVLDRIDNLNQFKKTYQPSVDKGHGSFTNIKA